MKKRVLLVAASLFVICASSGAQSVAENAPLETTEETSDSIEHEDVIVQPEYPGGVEKLYDFIIENFEYPENCKKRNVRGTVEMEFTIEKSGDISAVGILKGLDPEFDAELIRVFKAMPLWKPATRNGNPVRYKVYMPISLKFSRTNKLGFR